MVNHTQRQATEERAMVLDRFLDDLQLEHLGRSLSIDWFDDNSVGFRTRGVAQEKVAASLTTADELQDALNGFDLLEPAFPWFLGERYTVEWLEDRLVINEGADERERGTVRRKATNYPRNGIVSFVLRDLDPANPRCLSAFGYPVREGVSVSEAKELFGVAVTEDDRAGRRMRFAAETLPLLYEGIFGAEMADRVVLEADRMTDPDDVEDIDDRLVGRTLSSGGDAKVSLTTTNSCMKVVETEPDAETVCVTEETEVEVEFRDSSYDVSTHDSQDEWERWAKTRSAVADEIKDAFDTETDDRRKIDVEEIEDELADRLVSDEVADPDEDIVPYLRAGIKQLKWRGEIVQSGAGEYMLV